MNAERSAMAEDAATAAAVPPARRLDLRWRVGLLVFLVLALVGGACALWTLQQMRASSARAASQDARAMAESVAQTLALQLGRAVRLGIPLQELPGVSPYLASVRAQQAALAHIAVLAPDGQPLHSSGAAAARDDHAATARVPIGAPAAPGASGVGGVAGTVVVSVGGDAELQDSLAPTQGLSALAVLGLALAAALGAALGPGARLERQHQALLARLNAPAAPPVEPPARAEAPAPVLEALDQADAELQAAQESLRAYAEELLAMDFDGRMRADIERIVREAALPGVR